ncbi:MAG: ATPase subunit of ABC transporter with duplicated ATPase domains [Candidatus Omnitrophota bacterium]|jgi:ATPase subunit of ABC transporter with duplicated ATPase domains
MISTSNISLQYGKRVLFEKVSITFNPGNCYGLIGANGSGKSSFLKILSKEIESTSGDVLIPSGKRLSVLKQDHFQYDEILVLDVVIMGHIELFKVMQAKNEIYAKENFSDADGIKASELESEFERMDGWNAESDAAQLLSNLGIAESLQSLPMKELTGALKVRVLLAQAIFGEPDILLLDEPTNNLDIKTIMWLENFLYDFKNTVIVVSHDRHFLDQVCTHIADIDYSKIQLFVGNHSFWYQSSNLAQQQLRDGNKKADEKRKELQAFIARFSANASKSRQATSRKKMLEKIVLTDIKPTTRKYPAIQFRQGKEAGNNIIEIKKLAKSIDTKPIFTNLGFRIENGEKVAFVSESDISISTLFRILVDELQSDEGEFKWGASTNRSYYPKDNTKYFQSKHNLNDWLRQFSPNGEEGFIRGQLGRMLFSGEETLKKSCVLSGGEKVRCMLARMMLNDANVLIFDEPTSHLDLEAIESLNESMLKFPGTILFTSKDHALIQSIATRIIEITPTGVIDNQHMTYDEYLEKTSLTNVK